MLREPPTIDVPCRTRVFQCTWRAVGRQVNDARSNNTERACESSMIQARATSARIRHERNSASKTPRSVVALTRMLALRCKHDIVLNE